MGHVLINTSITAAHKRKLNTVTGLDYINSVDATGSSEPNVKLDVQHALRILLSTGPTQTCPRKSQ